MSALPPTITGCDQYLVQYGKSGGLGCFLAEQPLLLPRGASVLVQTPRGQEVGIAVRPATLLQARLLGAVASGSLLRMLDASEIAPHVRRSETLFADIRKMVVDSQQAVEVVDLDLCFGEDRAILHVVAAPDVDLTSFVQSIADRFALDIRIENLAGPSPVVEVHEEHGCDKPDCGKADGESSGCSTCSSGSGCGTGCGSATVDWRSYFVGLRERMPSARRPLL
ncbi:MAG: hypothetical protein K2X38_21945 [Gemmataceae bacterium]|nr:hypothetical protein [Gemmataceae bacterium]